MTFSALKSIALLSVFFALPMTAEAKIKMPSVPSGTSTDTKTKDCWMYIVTNLSEPSGTPPKMAYRAEDAYRKRLHSNTQKGQCLDNNAAKGEACKGMIESCAKNQSPKPGVTLGVVGAWVQWGTSYEDCPSLCPGFSNVSPKAFAPK